MTRIGQFIMGAKVFVAETSDCWIGVEVLDPEAIGGMAYVRVVWTNSLPGYEVGDRFGLDADTEVEEALTVDKVIARDGW